MTLCFPHQEIARHLRQGTLRALFGKDKIKNAVHCTDLPEDGLIEVGTVDMSYVDWRVETDYRPGDYQNIEKTLATAKRADIIIQHFVASVQGGWPTVFFFC